LRTPSRTPRSVDVGGAAVTLQVDDDDLVAFGQRGKDRPEHLSGPEPAVQQDHRPPGPVGFEAEVMPLTSTSWR
jgi:hypothetical protein